MGRDGSRSNVLATPVEIPMHVDDIGTHGGKVPYRENDRPVGAAVPEGMEGTMSSPVSLFKTATLVVDFQNRQRFPGAASRG